VTFGNSVENNEQVSPTKIRPGEEGRGGPSTPPLDKLIRTRQNKSFLCSMLSFALKDVIYVG
jgi:hypothetical protein